MVSIPLQNVYNAWNQRESEKESENRFKKKNDCFRRLDERTFTRNRF